MKIRSLLLGSIAATGLAASGYAADLGVVTSLDVCDELGLSGLTISSDDNCLQITGNVSMEYSIGDYGTSIPYVAFAMGGTYSVDTGNGVTDADLDIDAWLKFVATADSDFGPATATIKLLVDSFSGFTGGGLTGDPAVVADEAWVGIGDTTMLMAGRKSSIFNDGDDAPLNYLGLFNSSNVDAGVGFRTTGAATGGNVIQVVSNLGNGLSIGGGVEDLQTSSPAVLTGVGVIAYAGDGISAHASGAMDVAGAWKLHAGFKGTWDPITIVGAVAADDTGWWNVLGSASATFDMFTLAASAEATSSAEWGVGGSLAAAVTDGVTLNLGGRYFVGASTVYQVEAGVSAAVTETITLTAAVGAEDSTTAAAAVYGKAGLAWAPGGGFTASIAGEANTLGAYKATFKAAKSIK
jgi:hypothetical protein